MERNRLSQMLHRRCPRCGSVMFYEKFFHETEYVWGWQCVLCGEFIDRVVLENRQYQKKIQGNRHRTFVRAGTHPELSRFF